MAADFETQGRLWLRQALNPEDLRALRDLSVIGDRPGNRVDRAEPLFQAVLNSEFLEAIGTNWPGMKLVRLLVFDKSADSNWSVPWHQDRVIAVHERKEFPGFANWSQKSGCWHCEPPLEILQRMLFVRLHLDACGEDNGPMEIALGSHGSGLVPATDAEDLAATCETEVCLAKPGDILVLKMLTLHRSKPSNIPANRLTLRLDFSPDLLPEPLEWA